MYTDISPHLFKITFFLFSSFRLLRLIKKNPNCWTADCPQPLNIFEADRVTNH